MDNSAPIEAVTRTGDILPPDVRSLAAALPVTPAAQAALDAAQALARKAAAPATRRAYRADWTHDAT